MNFKDVLEKKKAQLAFKRLEKMSIKEIDKMIEILQTYREERMKYASKEKN